MSTTSPSVSPAGSTTPKRNNMAASPPGRPRDNTDPAYFRVLSSSRRSCVEDDERNMCEHAGSSDYEQTGK
ncbi:unnamed protein product [Caretta caretta]